MVSSRRFKDNGRLDEQAFSPMVAGEIREFLVVVEAEVPPGVELDVTLIKCMARMLFESNYDAGSPKVKDTVTYAAHSIYCASSRVLRPAREQPEAARKDWRRLHKSALPLAFFASPRRLRESLFRPDAVYKTQFPTFKMTSGCAR